MSPEQKREIFARHPFFNLLSTADLDKVIRHAHFQSYPKGERIFCKGDPGQGLLAIVRGTVKISSPSAEGREVVLNLMREGEIFGEMALLDGKPRSADATALTDCHLLALNRRDFLPMLCETPGLALKVMELLCQRLRQTNEHVEDLAFLDLSGHLAKVLLRLAGPEKRAPVRITQQELSDIICMSRESTNKQLRAWEDKGWVQLEKGGVLIKNADALARHASHD